MLRKYNDFVLERRISYICNILIDIDEKLILMEKTNESSRKIEWDNDGNIIEWDNDGNRLHNVGDNVEWNIKNDDIPNTGDIVEWDSDNNIRIKNNSCVNDINKIKTHISNIRKSLTNKETAKKVFLRLYDKINRHKFKVVLLSFLVMSFSTILNKNEISNIIDKNQTNVQSTIDVDKSLEIYLIKISKDIGINVSLSTIKDQLKGSEECSLVNDIRTDEYLEDLKNNDIDRYNYANMSREEQIVYTLKVLDNESVFLKKLAFRESSFRPFVVNKCGYFGLFQFGRFSIKEMERVKNGSKKHGISKDETYGELDLNFDRRDFSKCSEKLMPEEQIKIIKYLNDKNKHYLRAILTKDGKRLKKEYRKLYINGVSQEISLSGLLASSHLIGASELIKYFKSGAKAKFMPNDGNGVSADYYMDYFNNIKDI